MKKGKLRKLNTCIDVKDSLKLKGFMSGSGGKKISLEKISKMNGF